MSKNRLQIFQHWLVTRSLDGYIVSKKENIAYLTHLIQIHPTNREALLFVSPNQALLYHSPFLTPTRYPRLETLVMSPANQLPAVATRLFNPKKAMTIGIESTNLTVSEYNRFLAIFPQATIDHQAVYFEATRQIKDNLELKHIKNACHISSLVMSNVLSLIESNIGMSESDIAFTITQELHQHHVDKISFPTLVAIDENSASPHHTPTQKKTTKNSVVLIDFGCQIGGYASDMTRTIQLGKQSNLFKQIAVTVQNAYDATLLKLKESDQYSSLTPAKLDHTARHLITKAGYGPNFTHTTGHGLGLEIHEPPSLNTNNSSPLQTNMIITIEPGIYLENQFGFRHENTIHLSESGPIELTQYPN